MREFTKIESDLAAGMIKEMELLRKVAKERGIELGNPFDAVKGFLEFELKGFEEK